MLRHIDALKAENARLREALEKVEAFWRDHGAWGDFASLTSAAGAFESVANAARVALKGKEKE